MTETPEDIYGKHAIEAWRNYFASKKNGPANYANWPPEYVISAMEEYANVRIRTIVREAVEEEKASWIADITGQKMHTAISILSRIETKLEDK